MISPQTSHSHSVSALPFSSTLKSPDTQMTEPHLQHPKTSIILVIRVQFLSCLCHSVRGKLKSSTKENLDMPYYFTKLIHRCRPFRIRFRRLTKYCVLNNNDFLTEESAKSHRKCEQNCGRILLLNGGSLGRNIYQQYIESQNP